MRGRAFTFVKLKSMRIVIITLLVVCQAISIEAQSPEDKLIASFPFANCKASDDTGNGSSGALFGGVTCSCGVLDSALRFDGVDDAVFFVGPLGDVFTTSDFTISFYMRPDQQAQTLATQIIMSKQENCTPNKAFWVRYSPLNRTISAGISESETALVTLSARLDRHVCWQFVTLVRKGPVFSLYLNNALRDSKSTKARLDLSTPAIFKISEPVCPLDNRFQGYLDEVRIFSKALDPPAIRNYYYAPNRILNGDTLLYLGNSMQVLANASCADKFNWVPATGVSDPSALQPTITPELSGPYILQSLFDDGCSALDTLFITVIDPDTLDCEKIFLPNAFTPGSSFGRNDRFQISNPFSVSDFMSFEVFDRWGGRVFSAVDQFDAWDGNFQGSPVNPGVFLYRLRYRCIGREKVVEGTVTVLR